jgi:sulfonate transport system permease protein
MRNRLAHAALPLLLPVSLLLVWQAASESGILPSRILPAPSAVARAAVQLTWSGELLQNLLVSFRRSLIGLLIGGAIGFSLGMLNGLSYWADRLLDSSIQMLRTIPHLALAPLVILWFGIEEGAKLFLVSLGVMFPIYLNTYHGIRSIDPGLVEMGRVQGLSRWELFRKIILPGALPSILVGLRYALGVMWLTLIVAETISANSGIGYMAMNAREFLRTDVVVLSILLYACLGKSADWAARRLERRWLRWNPAYMAADAGTRTT